MGFIQSSTAAFNLTNRHVVVVCQATDLGTVDVRPGGFVQVPGNIFHALIHPPTRNEKVLLSGSGSTSKWKLTLEFDYSAIGIPNPIFSKKHFFLIALLIEIYRFLLSLLSFCFSIFPPPLGAGAAQITITVTNRGLPQILQPIDPRPHP